MDIDADMSQITEHLKMQKAEREFERLLELMQDEGVDREVIEVNSDTLMDNFFFNFFNHLL